MIFPFFIKWIWLGVGFLNRTGAELVINLIKNAKSFFIIEKIKKYRVPSSVKLVITCPIHMAARRLNKLVIIDALHFSNFKQQFWKLVQFLYMKTI